MLQNEIFLVIFNHCARLKSVEFFKYEVFPWTRDHRANSSKFRPNDFVFFVFALIVNRHERLENDEEEVIVLVKVKFGRKVRVGISF